MLGRQALLRVQTNVHGLLAPLVDDDRALAGDEPVHGDADVLLAGSICWMVIGDAPQPMPFTVTRAPSGSVRMTSSVG